MKLKILKTCQPNSQKYEKGKVYNVGGVDANHLLTRELAERVDTKKSYTEKVSESTSKKSGSTKKKSTSSKTKK